MGKKEITQVVVLLLVVVVAAGAILRFAFRSYLGREFPTFTGENLQNTAGEFVFPDLPWGSGVEESFKTFLLEESDPVTQRDPDRPTGIALYATEAEALVQVLRSAKDEAILLGHYSGKAEVELEFCSGAFSGVYYTVHFVPRVAYGRDDIIDKNAAFTLNEIQIFYEGIRIALADYYGEPAHSEPRSPMVKNGKEYTDYHTRSDEWVSKSSQSRLVMRCLEGKDAGTVTLGIYLPEGKME